MGIVIVWITVFLFSGINFCFAQSESITITTYYPSPNAVFDIIRLFPTDDIDPGDPCNEGELYYDDSENQLYICGAAGWQTNTGLWGSNGKDIFPNDISARVGIGDAFPQARLEVEGRLLVDSGAVHGIQGFGPPDDASPFMEDFWYDGGVDTTYFFRHIAPAGPNSRLIIGTGVPGAGLTPIMGVYNSGNVIISPDTLTTLPKERLVVDGNIQMDIPVESKIIGRYMDVMVGGGFFSPGIQIKNNASCMWLSSANGSGEDLMQICDSTNLLVGRQVRIFGDLQVDGALSKGLGAFLVDHPLEPKNKILRHSFVESPDMKNIYDGIAVLDEKGEAVVQLPDYFEALNMDLRYQLTPIEAYGPVYIKQEVKDNKFVIAGGYSNLKVSWMVTGSRKDAYALKNPIVVEEVKGVNNTFKKGEYLHPEAFGGN